MYDFIIKRNSPIFSVTKVERSVTLDHSGRRGLTGEVGPIGPQGIQGIQGIQGEVGQGVPAGGTTGQLLAKNSNTDYDSEWLTHGDAIFNNASDFATSAQGLLADSAIQPGDNISQLVNDSGFLTNISSFDTDDLAEGATNKYFSNALADARANAMIAAVRGQADGLASLGSDGKIPTGQLPALAISDTFVVASQVAMLALTAEVGDIAVRTDLNKSYILKTAGASTLGNWQELLTPTDAVLSVNGQTGAVSLTTSDIAEGTNQYFTSSRVQTVGDARYLQITNNLSDLNNAATARTNLGLVAGGAGDVWVEKAGDTMTGKLLFSGVSSDFGIDLAGSALKLSSSLIIDGNPQNFNWPYVKHTVQPAAFIYLDSQFGVFRIGTQKPSSYNSISFELPVNNEYQDVMSISTSALAPASALNNSVNLGASGNRWLAAFIGSNGINSNGDILLNSASVEYTPAPATDVTESGIIATLTAAEALVFGDVCYINSSGKLAKGDADAIATAGVVGMALATISADASGKFLLFGFVRNDAWNWTVGGQIYLSNTTGAMTQTAPSGTDDVIQVLGYATHADRMLFNPNSAMAEVA